MEAEERLVRLHVDSSGKNSHELEHDDDDDEDDDDDDDDVEPNTMMTMMMMSGCFFN